MHDGDRLPAGIEFLHWHADWLSERPLWLSSVGVAPAVRVRRGRWIARHARLPQAVEAVEAVDAVDAVDADSVPLAVRDHHNFAGSLEPCHLPWYARPFVRAIGARFGDFRDWDVIDVRACDIARKSAAA